SPAMLGPARDVSNALTDGNWHCGRPGTFVGSRGFAGFRESGAPDRPLADAIARRNSLIRRGSARCRSPADGCRPPCLLPVDAMVLATRPFRLASLTVLAIASLRAGWAEEPPAE